MKDYRHRGEFFSQIKSPRSLSLLAGLWVCIIFAGWPLVDSDEIGYADAIVVIGGDHKPERVLRAVELYQQGFAPVVIISAGTLVKEGAEVLAEAEVMRRQAVALGLPETAIILENQSQSTFQNAYFTSAICQKRGYGSIILVTSTFHSRRAGHIFREVFGPTPVIHIQPAPVGACIPCWWFQPNQISVVFYEYYNWARYWLGIRLVNETLANQ